MKEENRNGRWLNQDLLKWIALISMTIDHAGMVLFPQAEGMRLLGRLAFPIYVFLLVQGFLHTGSRMKYMIRLAVFAFLSELPFDLACYGRFSWQGQSVFLTLLLCLLMLWLLELIQDGKSASGWLGAVLPAAVILLFAALTWILQCDYDFSAPFLAAGLYFYKVHAKRIREGHYRISSPYPAFLMFLIAMFFGWQLDGYSAAIAVNGVLMECFCIPSAWLIEHCSGIRSRRGGKYFFYLYYPLHLILLYGISVI